MMDLEERAVAIAGGAGDLGRAIARVLLEHGARVALIDRSPQALAAAAAELSGAPAAVTADLAVEAEAVRAFREAEAALKGWNGLVNAVGVFQAVPIVELSVEDWDRMLAINLRSTFLACREAVRRGRPGFSIVNIASLAGQVGGIVAGANYAASKAGVISLTRSLAKQTRGLGIRVNCINPGVIDSRMTRQDWPPGRLEAMVKEIPLGRLGTPRDVAGVVLFLMSEESGYIHGAQIDVNGGIHVG